MPYEPTLPPRPSLSEVAAQADRNEWRQRCEDIYNLADTDGSDDSMSDYNPKVATLGVMDIPWPAQILCRPKSSILNRLTLDDLTPRNVTAFLEALAVDEGEDIRKVLSDAAWYFDPERFGDEILPRVFDGHRELVRDGVTRVWGTITDLLAHPDTAKVGLGDVKAGEFRTWKKTLVASTARPTPPS
jgi:hypothetical protein